MNQAGCMDGVNPTCSQAPQGERVALSALHFRGTPAILLCVAVPAGASADHHNAFSCSSVLRILTCPPSGVILPKHSCDTLASGMILSVLALSLTLFERCQHVTKF